MPKFRYFRKPTKAKFRQAQAAFAKICKRIQWREDLILNGGRIPDLVAIRRQIAQEMCFKRGFVPIEIAYAMGRERTAIYGLLEMRKGEKNYDYRPERA